MAGCRLASSCASCVALILATACAPASIKIHPARPVLAVVTWNTDAGDGDLVRLVADLERGDLARSESTGYLLLLQEATAAEAQAVSAPRGWTTWFVPVRGLGDRMRGNAIVSSLPLHNPRTVPLPRERQTRAAAAARISVEGHDLWVASVHLENRVTWWKGWLPSDTARAKQVDGLLKALPEGEAGILGGDFNTWLGPNEPAWRALARRFPGDSKWPRSPTFGNRLVLDHLLMDLPAGWDETQWVLDDDYGSDHHPVIAVVHAITE